MVRLIKRYESRKLYDTEESRYVSLEELARWIRDGQEIRVIENASSADVTAQTLTQIILDQGRSGRSSLPHELLHELIRFGGRAWSTGVEQVQTGVDRILESSIQRLAPVRQAREEMSSLRRRLRELESSLEALETAEAAEAAPATEDESERTTKSAGSAATRRGKAGSGAKDGAGEEAAEAGGEGSDGG